MTIRYLALAFLLLSCRALTGVTLADDWPQWRGPDRSGVSKETGLLKAWSKEGPKLVWTFKNAGEGMSSFAVVGDSLYTLGTRGGDEIVLAIDVNKGQEKWAGIIGPIFKALGNWGHGPRSTPSIDGDRLYALGSQGDVVCLDLANKGKEVWRKNYQKDFGGQVMDELGNWGWCESPLVDGPHLICTPGGEKGTVVALDKKDGRLVWRATELKNKAPDSSIAAADIHGVRQYILNSYVDTVGGFVSGVAAKDGKLLWSVPIFKDSCFDIAATPIVKDNYVYVTTYMPVSGSHCFELDKAFKVRDLYSKANQKAMKSNHGGVVLVGDHIYGYCDKAGWACQELKTGERTWLEREKLKGDKSGACTAAEGLLYLLTDEGEVGLVRASPKGFEEISSFKLPETSTIPQTVATSKDSQVWAHPVVAGGRLYVRDHDLVFCFDVKGK